MDRSKFAVTQWGMPDEGLYAVKLAADAGLDGLQLGLGSYEKGFPLSQRQIREEYLRAGEQYGIEFPSICIGDFAVNSFVQGPDTHRLHRLYGDRYGS